MICLVAGLNQTAIASGVVATATFTASPTTLSASSAVQMVSAVGSTPGGSAITASAVGGTVIIIQPQPASLICAPASVATPGTSACTVTLSSAAPVGGSSVGLSSNNASVTVPASVTVNGGASTTSFTATAAAVSSNVSATLTATLNGGSSTFSLGLTTAPAALSSLSCLPAVLNPGGTSTCTVSLTKAATSVFTVNLSSSQTAVTVPATVTVASGSASNTFTATAGPVSSSTAVTVTAAAAGATATASITDSPVLQPASLICTPASVATPGTSACTVTLSSAAPAGGSSVGLSSNNASATVPASVTVNGGASTASFTATTAVVSSDTSATLTATLNGGSSTFSLGLSAPAALSSLSCLPAVLNPGGTSTCTVSLTKAATSVFTVNLSSSQTAVTVPATVTVASGSASNTFTATAGPVSSSTAVTITATAAGATATASITDSPVLQPASLSCTPASVATPGTSACAVTLSSAAPAGGSSVSLSSNNASVTVPASVTVNGGASTANFTATAAAVSSNIGATLTATLNGGSITFALGLTASASSTPDSGLRFVPVTPCRVADTRNADGAFGGPSLGAAETRSFAIPQGSCGIPATAQAYSLNVTVVPEDFLGYLALWPTGQTQPTVSTLNSYGGTVVANAAIVPAGTGGAVSVYVTNPTDVILDINGYFDTSTGATSYSFYPATPCRVADTRNATGQFGGPTMQANQSRDFPIPLSSCDIPAMARGYSLNATVVPEGFLGYLATWPTGQTQPNVSTLNSYTGNVVANAAILPAGTNESISVFVTNPTDVILDINGYFGQPGSPNALLFYPVTPCRVADTRNAAGPFGGPEIGAGMTRSFTIPASACNIPSTATAYSLNVTVVPDGMLHYLTVWAAGATQPQVSTLNSYDGSVLANAAIVPAGTDGAIDLFVTDATQVILDISGYFAP